MEEIRCYSDHEESPEDVAIQKDIDETLLEQYKSEEITPEDIHKSFENSMFNEDKKYEISPEDTVKLLEIIDKVRNKENINIYSSLPESVKNIIIEYMKNEGVQGYSVQANSIRNMLAASLIDEFISNISIDKTVESFNKEMEDLFDKTGQEFSKMYKEYETERTKYLEAALEKIPEGDPKRELVTDVLDAINDAYRLSRIRNGKKIKLKNFEKEKPEKVFKEFEFKYQNQKYKIHPIKDTLKILTMHLTEEYKLNGYSEDESILRGFERARNFLLIFCKFCSNYKVSNPAEHAFMYYTLYNISLLDIFKGEEYKEFSESFIDNINSIMDLYK